MSKREKLAKLAPGSIRPGAGVGGEPTLTAQDVAGAAQFLSRPRWLACTLKFALDNSVAPELERLLIHRFIAKAQRERLDIFKPTWEPPEGVPRKDLIRRLARTAIAETLDPRRGFDLGGLTPKQFEAVQDYYEIIHDDLNFLASDGAQHIIKRLGDTS